MGFKVVITDYYYPNLDEEKKVFADSGIEIIDCNGKLQTEEQVMALTKDADAIITQFTPITKRVIDNLTRCKVIVRYAIGVDIIDIKAATAKKIMVANVPDYCIEEVANQALALMMTVVKKVAVMDRETRQGRWSYKKAEPLYRLSRMNLGIVAFGRIARDFTRKAQVLGFQKIYAYDPYIKNSADFPDIEFVSLEELLSQSNIVSIHAPATEETKHLINKDTLRLMPDGSFLINTSRGALINEADLVEALKAGKLAGVGLDVLEKEEITPEHPLLQFDNVVITPHMGWYSVDSISELQRKVAQQVKEALLEGEPKNWLNRF